MVKKYVTVSILGLALFFAGIAFAQAYTTSGNKGDMMVNLGSNQGWQLLGSCTDGQTFVASSGATLCWVCQTFPVTLRSQTSSTRSLNSAFQISTSSGVNVVYSIDISATLSLSGGQSGSVVLEIASDSGFTSNVQTLSQFTNSNSGTLTIGLNITQTNTAVLTGYIPTGYYARLRTINNTGSPTYTFKSGQELLF